MYEPLLLSEPSDVQLSQHPLVQLSYQEANIAEHNKRLERAQALPDLTLGYTNQSLIGMQTIGGVETYTDRSKRFHFATIGLSVPIFYRYPCQGESLLNIRKKQLIEEAQQT